jgi:hypothetical protein
MTALTGLILRCHSTQSRALGSILNTVGIARTRKSGDNRDSSALEFSLWRYVSRDEHG